MRRFTAAGLAALFLSQSAGAQTDKKPISMAPPLAVATPHVVSPAKTNIRKDIQAAVSQTYPRTHFQRALLFKQRGDLNNALIEFLKATQENPRLVKAFYEQALIFRQRGYLKLAESSLEQALAVQPSFQQASLLLATLRLEQGKIGDAMQELSRSLGIVQSAAKAPEKPPAHQAALEQSDVRPEAKEIAQQPQTSPFAPPPIPSQPSEGHSSSMSITMESDTPEAITEHNPKSISDSENQEIDGILKGIPGVDPQASDSAPDSSQPDDPLAKIVASANPISPAPAAVASMKPEIQEQRQGRKARGWFSPRFAKPKMPHLPELKFPEVKLPEMKFPEMKLPDMKLPDIKLPQVPQKSRLKEPPKAQLPKLPKLKTSPLAKRPNQDESDSWFSKIFGAKKSLPPPAAISDLQQEYAQQPQHESKRKIGTDSGKTHFPSLKELEEMSMVIHQPQPGEEAAKAAAPVPIQAKQSDELRPELPSPTIPGAEPSSEKQASPMPTPTPEPGTHPLPRIVVVPPAPRPGISLSWNPFPQLIPKHDPNPPKAPPEPPKLSRKGEHVHHEPTSYAPQTVNNTIPDLKPHSRELPKNEAPAPTRLGNPPRTELEEILEPTQPEPELPPVTAAKPVLRKQEPIAAGPTFSTPHLPSANKSTLLAVAGKSAGATKPKAAPAKPPEDPWVIRLRYLAEHGTGTLKPGEAFMFSEETGEAVIFLQDGRSVRRNITPPRDREELVKERRPDMLIPQELMYNLSLLGKLLPHQEPQPQPKPAGTFPTVEELLKDQQEGFWGWLTQRFRLPGQ
jgi:hypothetical protein